jgi:hypothetical protein
LQLDRVMFRLQTTLLALILGTLCFEIAVGQVKSADVNSLVNAELWSEKERADYAKGEPVVRSLQTGDKQEVATVGVVRILGLPAGAMDTFRRSISPKSDIALHTGGKFGRPPTVADLKDLDLDEDTITQLRRCTVGRCDLNLSRTAIERFETIDWDSASVKQDVTQMIREVLVDYASRYSTGGVRSLGTYDNRRKSVNLTTSHETLLQSFGPVSNLAPEFLDYIARYPNAAMQDVQDSLRWSLVDFGLKPSITLVHTAAYTRAKDGSDDLFIASRQIYSSRYLDSSLSFAMLLRPRDDPGAAYLIFMDRSRSDVFDGPFGGAARRAVQGQARERVRSMLESAHIRLMSYSRVEPDDRDAPSNATQRVWWLLTVVAIALASITLIALRKIRQRPMR